MNVPRLDGRQNFVPRSCRLARSDVIRGICSASDFGPLLTPSFCRFIYFFPVDFCARRRYWIWMVHIAHSHSLAYRLRCISHKMLVFQFLLWLRRAWAKRMCEVLLTCRSNVFDKLGWRNILDRWPGQKQKMNKYEINATQCWSKHAPLRLRLAVKPCVAHHFCRSLANANSYGYVWRSYVDISKKLAAKACWALMGWLFCPFLDMFCVMSMKLECCHAYFEPYWTPDTGRSHSHVHKLREFSRTGCCLQRHGMTVLRGNNWEKNCQLIKPTEQQSLSNNRRRTKK